MTSGARTLRIVVAVIFVAALLAAAAAAWLRTEHPRPEPEEAGHDHAVAVVLPQIPGSHIFAPSVPRFSADGLRRCGSPETCT